MAIKTIFISTGEVSGDLQGSLLIKALKRHAQITGLELEIVALGGERMAAAGAKLLVNTTGIGSVGLLESLPFLLPTLQIQGLAREYLQQHPPEIAVLIDYFGPNLVIGNLIRSRLPQVPIVYYIAPQDWVWSVSSRNTAKLVKMTDKMLAIFPEEARYFQKKGASVSWVGHPLVDKMQSSPSREQARAALGIEPEQIAIALVPASRKQELKYMLPVICEAAKRIQSQLLGRGGDEETWRRGEGETRRWGEGESLYSSLPQNLKLSQDSPLFWIPLALEAYRRPIEAAIESYGLRATVVCEQTTEVLAAVDLAIAKSGTVNLELALLNVPQVVLYRVSPFTAWFARTFLNFSIPFMSPPNLVVMRSIVPELLQEEATAENIVQEALELLLNPQRRQQILADYQEMRSLLGEVGVCDRAAREILQLAKID